MVTLENQLKLIDPSMIEITWPLSFREKLKITRWVMDHPESIAMLGDMLEKGQTTMRVAISLDIFFCAYYVFTLGVDCIILLTYLRFSNRVTDEA